MPDPEPLHRGAVPTPVAWSGRSLALPGGCVLLGATDVAYVRGLIKLADEALRRDGIALPPGLVALRAIVAAAAKADPDATSTNGLLDVQHEMTSATWGHDEIPLTEAAELLGVGRRHANRLAHAGLLGPTRKVSGRWLVSRTEVTTYLIDKENRAS